MQINPGELRHKILICKNDSVIHKCRAKVNNISGTQQIKNGAELNKAKTRFVIRYTDKKINSDMEIVFNEQRYSVVYANEYGFEHKYIEIICELIDWS